MAFLQSLEIENFRGFFGNQKVAFAIPDGSEGSGLTVLVGPNNSGKSTILKALLKFDVDKEFYNFERNHSDDDVQIKLTDTDGKNKLTKNINGGSDIQVIGNSEINKDSFEFINSRRSWRHRFNFDRNYNYELYYKEKSVREALDIIDDQLGKVLSSFSRPENISKKRELTKIIKDLVPGFTSWTIDSDDQGRFIQYITKGNLKHRADLLGDGVSSLFRITAHLVNSSQDKILLIDEPELSLHPQAQRKLAKILSNESANRQIIIATHSPYFINIEDLLNKGSLIRLNKIEDKKCVPSILDNDLIEKIKNRVKNYQTPQLFDIVAKEIFFGENIVFTEGQEDVGLLRAYFAGNNNINFSLFGYGCCGAGSIETFLKIADNLNIKAGALFDGDKRVEYEKCKNDFQNFEIQILSTSDIRDKYKKDEHCNPTEEIDKEGIFYKEGVIKEDKKAELDTIAKKFIDFFEPSE